MLIRMRNDDGNILITVVLVSMLVGMLASLVMHTADRSSRSSASDRNHQIALGVAEAGIQQGVARIEAQSASGYVGSFSLPPTTTPEGTYQVSVTRSGDSFVIDAQGTVGGATLGRSRHVKVSMRPPPILPATLKPAFFSSTSLEIKNNAMVHVGDVWANDSLLVKQGTTINGNITSAQSWIDLENGADISGDALSGGHSVDGWSIRHAGDRIGGSVKSTVAAPTCEEPASSYDVIGSGLIGRDLTTWGTSPYPAEISGAEAYHVCTKAPAPIPMPTFTFNPANYDDPSVPDDYFEFTIPQFHNYINTHYSSLKGTFVVRNVPAPSQENRIELCVHNGAGSCVNGSQVSIGGDVTLITDAPVYTADIDDAAVAESAKFVVVSHYDPPPSTSCDVNDDDSECAIHAKNHFQFDGDCKTATLLYADNGPVAVKNNAAGCGSVVAEGILTKNGLEFEYDDRVDRLLGIGPTTFVVERWEEHPPA